MTNNRLAGKDEVKTFIRSELTELERKMPFLVRDSYVDDDYLTGGICIRIKGRNGFNVQQIITMDACSNANIDMESCVKRVLKDMCDELAKIPKFEPIEPWYTLFPVSRTAREKADDYIERVIFNPPATIVFFKDGKKVVVKCQEDDDWDEEKALAMAIIKHDYGLSAFNKTLEKAERRYPDSNISIDIPSLVDGVASAAEAIMRILGGGKNTERTCKNCRFNELVWSPKYEKFMPFCASSNPMINHHEGVYKEYEGFCCSDFEPKEEKK